MHKRYKISAKELIDYYSMNKYVEIYSWDVYYLKKLIEYLESIYDPLDDNEDDIANAINSIKQIIDEWNGVYRRY